MQFRLAPKEKIWTLRIVRRVEGLLKSYTEINHTDEFSTIGSHIGVFKFQNIV